MGLLLPLFPEYTAVSGLGKQKTILLALFGPQYASAATKTSELALSISLVRNRGLRSELYCVGNPDWRTHLRSSKLRNGLVDRFCDDGYVGNYRELVRGGRRVAGKFSKRGCLSFATRSHRRRTLRLPLLLLPDSTRR